MQANTEWTWRMGMSHVHSSCLDMFWILDIPGKDEPIGQSDTA